MTLQALIGHAQAGTNAVIAIAQRSCTPIVLKDGDAGRKLHIDSGSSLVVHELEQGEEVSAAENRALERMWDAFTAKAGDASGATAPPWAELEEELRDAWRAALHAI